ncbi:hypothetical protein QBC36DRAFT_314866 [Triangularia setosa]|uniref:Uncharacterized protein n=1 Tax=Triangularia setosa TaxID=2587417 RepID=A0AAN7A214_9PEZI|nr:hypothetical protein QBC36DRAFT_314866 [Podospora setosa]
MISLSATKSPKETALFVWPPSRGNTVLVLTRENLPGSLGQYSLPRDLMILDKFTNFEIEFDVKSTELTQAPQSNNEKDFWLSEIVLWQLPKGPHNLDGGAHSPGLLGCHFHHSAARRNITSCHWNIRPAVHGFRPPGSSCNKPEIDSTENPRGRTRFWVGPELLQGGLRELLAFTRMCLSFHASFLSATSTRNHQSTGPSLQRRLKHSGTNLQTRLDYLQQPDNIVTRLTPYPNLSKQSLPILEHLPAPPPHNSFLPGNNPPDPTKPAPCPLGSMVQPHHHSSINSCQKLQLRLEEFGCLQARSRLIAYPFSTAVLSDPPSAAQRDASKEGVLFWGVNSAAEAPMILGSREHIENTALAW